MSIAVINVETKIYAVTGNKKDDAPLNDAYEECNFNSAVYALTLDNSVQPHALAISHHQEIYSDPVVFDENSMTHRETDKVAHVRGFSEEELESDEYRVVDDTGRAGFIVSDWTQTLDAPKGAIRLFRHNKLSNMFEQKEVQIPRTTFDSKRGGKREPITNLRFKLGALAFASRGLNSCFSFLTCITRQMFPATFPSSVDIVDNGFGKILSVAEPQVRRSRYRGNTGFI